MNNDVAAKLKAAVGPKGFTEDPAEIAPHLEEWRSKYKGRATLLLRPATTAEDSRLWAVWAMADQGSRAGSTRSETFLPTLSATETARVNRVCS